MHGCMTFSEFIQIILQCILNSNMEAGLHFNLSNLPLSLQLCMLSMFLQNELQQTLVQRRGCITQEWHIH
jgi:hypothetical protein